MRFLPQPQGEKLVFPALLGDLNAPDVYYQIGSFRPLNIKSTIQYCKLALHRKNCHNLKLKMKLREQWYNIKSQKFAVASSEGTC